MNGSYCFSIYLYKSISLEGSVSSGPHTILKKYTNLELYLPYNFYDLCPFSMFPNIS